MGEGRRAAEEGSGPVDARPDGAPTSRAAGSGGGRGGLETAVDRAAALAPWLVLIYVAGFFFFRVSLSPFLEIDEAQFVGQVDFRLVYENSHPPLYNWLLRIVLELTRWNWPVSTALVKYGLLLGFYLLAWDAARRLAGPRAALLAVAAVAFLPQIVWQSTHTLAHSVMVMTGSVALVHAAALLYKRQTLWRAVWFGGALALGTLAKYNFALFALPFLIAMAASRPVAQRVYSRLSLISLGVFLAAATPTLVAAALDLDASTERLEKLYDPNSPLAWLDLPGVGVDGFVSLLIAALAWAGPLAAVWASARFYDRKTAEPAAGAEHPLIAPIGWATLGAVGAFATVVLAADMQQVHERYLTPLLAAGPIWLACRLPLAASARAVLPLAAVAFLAAPVGVYAMVQTQKHRYALPYPTVAAQIRLAEATPVPILARRHSDVANLTLALSWPGAASPRYATAGDRILLVWRGRRDVPEGLAPPDFGPAGPIAAVRAAYLNARTDDVVFSFQAFERLTPPSP